jgi:ribosomal protein L40E
MPSAYANRSASAKVPADGEGSPPQPGATDDPWLQPWQFFLLGGMLAATATVIVATGQSPANIIILSLTVVSVSFVGLGAYRILLPLVSGDVEVPATIGGRTRAAMEREKTLVLRSIKELEFDYAMGKVARADFDEMSARLRARAAGLIRQLDAGGGYKEQIAQEVEIRLKADTTPAANTAGIVEEVIEAGTCAECGTLNDADAKFCKNCGAKL